MANVVTAAEKLKTKYGKVVNGKPRYPRFVDACPVGNHLEMYFRGSLPNNAPQEYYGCPLVIFDITKPSECSKEGQQ